MNNAHKRMLYEESLSRYAEYKTSVKANNAPMIQVYTKRTGNRTQMY